VSSFLDSFIAFLDYIGMVFGPILGIIIADFFFIHKRTYDVASLEVAGGKYWHKNGFNIAAFVVWIIGAAFFFSVHKLPFFTNSIGATYPTIVVCGILYYVFTKSKR
jgi:nucleobase:cation symporter-1, NCS1 family